MNLSSRALARIRDAAGPVLVDLSDPAERVVRLRPDGIRIGSAPDAALRFPESEAAPLVARIEPDGAGFRVVAVDAVELDGVPVREGALRNGARLTVAGHELLHVDPTAEIMPAGLQLLAGAPSGLPAPSLSTRMAEGESFGEMLLDRLRSTPWLLISLFVHALIYFAVVMTAEEPELPPPLPEITAEITAREDEDDLPFVPEVEEEIPDPENEAEVEVPELDVPTPDTSDPLPAIDDAAVSETEESLASLSGLGDFGDAGGGRGGGLGEDIGRAASGAIRREVGRLRASGLDIVFLIDATASMDQEIATTKRRLSEMIALLEGLGIAFRIGVVAFRDKETGDAFVTKELELTSTLYKAVHFVDGLRAEGGGDIPEAVFDAVEDGVRMRWSHAAKRVIVLIGDAPPKPGTVADTVKLVERFAQGGGVFHTIFTESETSAFHDGRGIFARLAEAGGGRAIELSGNDGVVEDMTLLALETEDRFSIRKMLSSLDEGLPVQVLRRALQRGDAKMVGEQLRRKNPRPDLPMELMRVNARGEDVAFIPAYLETLDDPRAGERSRWLAKLLLERSLVRLQAGRDATGPIRTHLKDALAALREIDPDDGPRSDRRAIAALGKALLDAGLLPPAAGDR